VGLSVLTGAGDEPAVMAGYGPIPAQLAREVAAFGTWRCAVVDDRPGSATHGSLLGLGHRTYSPGYVPSPATRQFVQLRDGHCVFPGCRRRAERCDIDHRRPWSDDTDSGGVTCECNLQSLCRHHHRLKSSGRFTVRATADGIEWTTPTGRRYHSPPNPVTLNGPQPPPAPVPAPPF
jgi:hypothetical protein